MTTRKPETTPCEICKKEKGDNELIWDFEKDILVCIDCFEKDTERLREKTKRRNEH